MPSPLFIVAILVGGLVFGSLARLVVPGSQRLSLAETTLVGIAGAGLGALVGNLLTSNEDVTSFQWGTGLGVLAGSVVVLLVATAVMRKLGIGDAQEEPRLPASELMAAGENHAVEFKQTARWNTHTRQKDPKLELVIAKTVAGFLNADGGTLLIGVNDDGVATGLDDDLTLMKEPDLDRYELWLTDFLERCLGKPAVTSVSVSFELVDKTQVGRVDVATASAPVFLDEPGGSRQADMYLRMGNSTRKLLTDEAMEYAGTHWS